MSVSEIDCKNCRGACCREMRLTLDRNESDFMFSGGTGMLTVLPAKEGYSWRKALEDKEALIALMGEEKRAYIEMACEAKDRLDEGVGYYIMLGACGYLENEDGWLFCSGYDDRPEICRQFEEGSAVCQVTRIVRGVDEASPEVQMRLVDLMAGRPQ